VVSPGDYWFSSVGISGRWTGVEIPHTLVGNWFGWKNHRIDPETGLVYMRHRYYLPRWGRFMSQDWLGVHADPGTFANDYSYGRGAPTVESDRLGLQVTRLTVTNGQILQLNNSSVNEGKPLDAPVPAGWPRNGDVIIESSVAADLYHAANGDEAAASRLPVTVHSVPALLEGIASLFPTSSAAALSEIARFALESHDGLKLSFDLLTGRIGGAEFRSQIVRALLIASVAGGIGGALKMTGKAVQRLHKHHPFPKFLGGADDIDNLINLPCGQHTDLHNMIMEQLAKRKISRPAKMKWSEFFEKNPGKQKEAMEALIDATEAFDKKHKTRVLDDLFETIIGGDWKDYSVK